MNGDYLSALFLINWVLVSGRIDWMIVRGAFKNMIYDTWDQGSRQVQGVSKVSDCREKRASGCAYLHACRGKCGLFYLIK